MMNRALFLNKYDENFGSKAHSYNYNLVNVCLPGKRVPRQFKYRTTKSTLIIPLQVVRELMGIIVCAIISPSEELMTQGARIWCQCYLEDGITKLGNPSSWYHKATTDIDSDHVYIWFDSFHFDSISEGFGQQISFKFYVTNDMEKPELNILTKECGVHLIYDEKECSGKNNQAWDLSTKCSDHDVALFPKRVLHDSKSWLLASLNDNDVLFTDKECGEKVRASLEAPVNARMMN
ncbi:unnamed protein product [Lupinus luteus]|uniref:C-JID domain-containing protein n=1 Tax=Lupinus luteus TaxID=3873 RepID=A0AAV1XIL9_LUPLU